MSLITPAYASTRPPDVLPVHNVPITVSDPILSSCVKYARYLGVPIPYGTDAEDIKPNTTIHVGAVAVFHYPQNAHVAVVQSFDADGFTIAEANYHAGKADTRIISYDDPFLIGFYDP